MLIKRGIGTRRAEAVHAQENAVRPDIALPAEPDAGLDCDAKRALAEHFVAIGRRLLIEELPARHRDDRGTRAFRFELCARGKCNLDLRTGREQRYAPLA